MPKVYALPGAKAPVGHTYFQVPVTPPDYKGPYKTMFLQAPRSHMTLGQITVRDGTSNTIMILEASKAVPWTAPEDVVLPADDQPLPKFGADPASGRFMACYGDGAVRFLLTTTVPPGTYQTLMRQLLGVNDGRYDDASVIHDPVEARQTRRPFRGFGMGGSSVVKPTGNTSRGPVQFERVGSTLPSGYYPTAPRSTVKSPTIRIPSTLPKGTGPR